MILESLKNVPILRLKIGNIVQSTMTFERGEISAVDVSSNSISIKWNNGHESNSLNLDKLGTVNLVMG